MENKLIIALCSDAVWETGHGQTGCQIWHRAIRLKPRPSACKLGKSPSPVLHLWPIASMQKRLNLSCWCAYSCLKLQMRARGPNQAPTNQHPQNPMSLAWMRWDCYFFPWCIDVVISLACPSSILVCLSSQDWQKEGLQFCRVSIFVQSKPLKFRFLKV